MLFVAQRGEVLQTPQSSRSSLHSGGDPVAVGVVGEDKARGGVVDQVSQLLGGEAVVQRDNDGTDLQRSDRRNDPLQAVVADDANPIAGLKLGSGQMPSGTIGPPVQRLVIDGVGAV